MTMYNLNAQILKRVAKGVGNKEMGHNADCVHVCDKDGVRVYTAMNGIILFKEIDTAPTGEKLPTEGINVVINRSTLKEITRKASDDMLNVVNPNTIIYGEGINPKMERADNWFYDVENVLIKKPNKATQFMFFNPVYMNDVHDFIGHDNFFSSTIRADEDNRMLQITSPDKTRIALIMVYDAKRMWG